MGDRSFTRKDISGVRRKSSGLDFCATRHYESGRRSRHSKDHGRGIMKFRYVLFVLAFLLLALNPAQATKISKADLEATHILMGKVENVDSFFGVNERGDQIIL